MGSSRWTRRENWQETFEDRCAAESLNGIWLMTVRQGTYYVWKWSVATRLGRWATRNLRKLLWLAGTEYQNWWTLHVIHKAAFPRLVLLTNTCHLLILVKSWGRCASPFPTWISVYVTQVERSDSISLRYDMKRYNTIFIYCNLVSTQWQWSLHCTQTARTVICIRRNKTDGRTHKMENKIYK
jgi:hypothetical protein